MPSEVAKLALSVKAVRYMGLLLAIPLFASLVKRKAHVPWFLWAFLGTGIVISLLLKTSLAPSVDKVITTFAKPLVDILWSMALASIGLNADLKMILTAEGLKCALLAFVGFLSAIVVFLAGFYIFV